MSFSNKTVVSAEERNTYLATQGYNNPPYQSGTPVVGFNQSGFTQYVRVYAQGNTEPIGKWIMRYEDIQGLTPQQIKDKFALPTLPTHICDVNVPAGTELHTGIAGPISEWGNGGGLQYDIIGTWDASWFVNGRPLS